MSKANDKLTEWLIYDEVANGATEITRERITERHFETKTKLGRDPFKGRGSNTTDVMIAVADDIGWFFDNDGRDASGKYIRPRIVKDMPLQKVA